ncbi:hypothetical protein LguiA_023500 [Lonicera macranthoides]
MSNLSIVEANLPAGFRFHPRDTELICDYLMKKVARCEQPPTLIEVDLNKCEPWDIPETACVGGKEWYFYSQRDRKYATGLRTNRATVSGYWKATGKDRPVIRRVNLVGMRKTLVFYQGRAPKGRKTDWVMHEFRLEGPLGPPKISNAKSKLWNSKFGLFVARIMRQAIRLESSDPEVALLSNDFYIQTLEEDWVLCRVFYKNREVAAKQGMGNSYNNHYDDNLSSSSLPPLMDPYITFDQTLQTNNNNLNLNHNNDQFEQVPCFSIFTPNQTFSDHITHMDPNIISTKIPSTNNITTFGAMPDIASYLNPSPSCDKKVIKAVLNHLSNMDTNPNYIKESPSFGEGSSESFLSDVGLPTMWYHY